VLGPAATLSASQLLPRAGPVLLQPLHRRERASRRLRWRCTRLQWCTSRAPMSDGIAVYVHTRGSQPAGLWSTIGWMKRRSVAVLLALAAIVVWIGWEEPGQQASARSRASFAVYTEPEVLRAFRNVGDRLYDTGYSSSLGSPVTVLATVKPYQGWNAAVYIYPKVSQATASFRSNSETWRASGIVASELRNLLVIVVRPGQVLARSARPLPMPQLILRALAFVRSQTS
jgi:hypothetical protein